MAWTAPMTAVANDIFTAAQFNTHVRDNLLETAPGKATTAGSIFVGTGANSIAERIPSGASIATSGTTTSTSYSQTLTAGGTNPTVSLVTGASVLVSVGAQMVNSGANLSYVGYDVSGASTIAATDLNSAANQGTSAIRASSAHFLTGLTPGTNTFTLTYKVAAGTGTFLNRRISVVPF